jgi:hypothetical protein
MESDLFFLKAGQELNTSGGRKGFYCVVSVNSTDFVNTLEQSVPRAFECCSDFRQDGQAGKIYTTLDRLNIPRTDPHHFSQNLLRQTALFSQGGDIFSKSSSLRTGLWLFRWHPQILAVAKKCNTGYCPVL